MCKNMEGFFEESLQKCAQNVNKLVANPDSYGTHGGFIHFKHFEYSWLVSKKTISIHLNYRQEE